MNNDSFCFALSRILFDNIERRYTESNWDKERFGEISTNNSIRSKIFNFVDNKLNARGYSILQPSKIKERYKKIIDQYGEGLSAFYSLLNDAYSKSALVELIAYRILGYEHMKLWTNNQNYWQTRSLAHGIPLGEDIVNSGNDRFPLSLMNLNKIEIDIELYSHPLIVAHQFLLSHYSYEQENIEIRIEDGDYVIDAGSAWGETALLFARDAGKTGKVFSFDINNQNMEIFKRNVAFNVALKDRISLQKNALWHRSGEVLSFEASGAGTRISDSQMGDRFEEVQSISIDDFAVSQEKIDFIKMDIEGAELSALKGARKTIEDQQPKLAISLYHKMEDFVEIPQYLSSLETDYEFYLDHCTIHCEETVLFAIPRK